MKTFGSVVYTVKERGRGGISPLPPNVLLEIETLVWGCTPSPLGGGGGFI
jgi:hypothetical protein